MARSTLQILSVVEECKWRGINLYVVKGGWSINGNLDSKVLLLVFSMVAEIERDLISARTKEALAMRKAQGMKLGRPRGPGKSKLDPHRKEIEALLRTGSTQKYICERYGTSRVNLARYLRKYNISVEPMVEAPLATA